MAIRGSGARRRGLGLGLAGIYIFFQGLSVLGQTCTSVRMYRICSWMCQERGAKEISQMKKQANQIAIRKEASLAALAWSKLETAAQEQLNGDVPALQLVADARGVTAIIR